MRFYRIRVYVPSYKYIYRRVYVCMCVYLRAFVTASGPEREPKTLYYIAVCDFNYKVKPFAVGIGARRRRATGPVIKTVRGPFVPVYLQITRYLGVHVFAINQPPGLLQRSLDGLVFNNRIKTTPSGPGARARARAHRSLRPPASPTTYSAPSRSRFHAKACPCFARLSGVSTLQQ